MIRRVAGLVVSESPCGLAAVADSKREREGGRERERERERDREGER